MHKNRPDSWCPEKRVREQFHSLRNLFCNFLFFKDPATTQIYTLSLHDALPISRPSSGTTSTSTSGSIPLGTSRSARRDRKSTRLNSSHVRNSYAVFCLKKKTPRQLPQPEFLDCRSSPLGARPAHSRVLAPFPSA